LAKIPSRRLEVFEEPTKTGICPSFVTAAEPPHRIRSLPA
jgi:hypothetical protein